MILSIVVLANGASSKICMVHVLGEVIPSLMPAARSWTTHQTHNQNFTMEMYGMCAVTAFTNCRHICVSMLCECRYCIGMKHVHGDCWLRETRQAACRTAAVQLCVQWPQLQGTWQVMSATQSITQRYFLLSDKCAAVNVWMPCSSTSWLIQSPGLQGPHPLHTVAEVPLMCRPLPWVVHSL